MSDLKGLKATKNKLSQKINIKDEFGFDPEKNPSLKHMIGQAMIDTIVDRTLSGKDNTGSEFSKNKYSESYASSDNFRLFGKSKGDVNLEQSGTMLGQLDIVEETPNTLTLGWEDEIQNKKAANHHQGITVPKRPFFGITSNDIDKIKKEYSTEINEAKERQRPVTKTAAEALDILRNAATVKVTTDTTYSSLFDAATLKLLDEDIF